MKFEFEEIDYNEAVGFSNVSFWDVYDAIKEAHIEIRFESVCELNPGRYVVPFTLLEHGIDITEKITNLRYCSPIRLNFINRKNNLLYFPIDDSFVFYNILTQKITKIKYDCKATIYEMDNSIICIGDTGFTKINLENHLKTREFNQNNINFVFPLETYDVVIYNDFLKYKTSNSFFSRSLQLNPSKLYDTSFNKFIETSFKESQKGYLWSNAIKVKRNELFDLPIEKWKFIRCSTKNRYIIIGTQLITDKGKFDNTQKSMVFNAENKYLKLKLKL